MITAQPTLASQLIFWDGHDPDTGYTKRGVILIDGTAYDIVATPSEIQPVPDNETIYDEAASALRRQDILDRHRPATTKEDHIAREIVNSFGFVRAIHAGNMWISLCTMHDLTNAPDNPRTHDWRLAFWTTWRKLKEELNSPYPADRRVGGVAYQGGEDR